VDLLRDPVLIWTAKLVLAALFGASGWAKMREWSAFTGVVANYRLLPGALVPPVAAVVPVAEVLVALGLLQDPSRPYAAAGAIALLALFSLAMGINLGRGRTEIDCGCFGSLLRQRLSWGLLVRNGALALLALACLQPENARPWIWLDAVTLVAGTLTLVLLYLAMGHLLGRPSIQE
jgi:uncharacterized membrane protein YphA (DoxX/SURF4 family)